MADLYTPQPDAALQLLRSQGASCGAGSPPATLKGCTSGHWCTWPSGGGVCLRAMSEAPPPVPGMAPSLALASGLGIMLIGVAIGWMLRRR